LIVPFALVFMADGRRGVREAWPVALTAGVVFAILQFAKVAAAHKANLSATLLAGANSSGGVLAKMVSPQNLAIGAAAVGLAGKEGDIFRQVIGYSVVFALLMGVLVLLQSGALSFMVP